MTSARGFACVSWQGSWSDKARNVASPVLKSLRHLLADLQTLLEIFVSSLLDGPFSVIPGSMLRLAPVSSQMKLA